MGEPSCERVGTGELEGLVKDLSMPVDFGLETMNTFIDWNRSVPFEVVRGARASARYRARTRYRLKNSMKRDDQIRCPD